MGVKKLAVILGTIALSAVAVVGGAAPASAWGYGYRSSWGGPYAYRGGPYARSYGYRSYAYAPRSRGYRRGYGRRSYGYRGWW